jgi:PAS domain S-box-containing protein
MTWTLRRILLVIVILSSLAVAGTLYWVTATYQQFAISNQNEITASTVSHLVRRQMEEQHQGKVNPFIDEWSRLSTLEQGMKEGNREKARLAANRMMLTLEVAEGRVRLRNVVIYTKEMQPVAVADKGTGESLSALPELINRLRRRDTHEQRQITSFLWRGLNGRPLYSTIAPVGGFQVAGFVEFVSDPIPDLAGIGDAVQGHFRLLDIHGTPLFEDQNGAAHATEPATANLDTLQVPIADALGRTWAIATLTRDVSAFQAAASQLRNRALGIVAAVILGSVLIGWLLLRLSVFSQLKGFAAVARMLAKGQTDVEIPTVGPDELAIMRTSLQSLRNAVSERQRVTAALRESEERLKAIIDNSPNAIYLKDTKGRYTLVNASTAEMQGLDPAEMIGTTAFGHLPKEIADLVASQEADVLESGEASERELELSAKKGGTRVGLAVKFPVFDANGVITGVGTIISDITERKRSETELLTAREKAEEQARLQRIILDNVGQGILVFSKDARLVLWNDYGTKFTGLSDAFLATEQTWDNCGRYTADEYNQERHVLEAVAEFERRIEAGERDFVISYQRRGRDGRGWVQVGLRSLSDGTRVQTYQDITDLHQAIDAAREAQRLAEDANRTKSDFLSNMSHELRTPLNAIIGFTEYVIDDDDDPITSEQHQSLSQVLKAGRHLLLLINDVLDLSRIEAGAISLSLEPVDPGLVIDECVSLMASFAASRNVQLSDTLTGTSLPPIEADRVRFKQVFLNLLSNAIKYNSDSGHVVIERGSAEAGMLRIGVRDDGPGIAEDRLAQLFSPFERLGAENSAIEGTGIGLTITKSLVDQMGGKMSVESIVGEGSTFWLEMPISQRAAEHRVETGELRDGLMADVRGLVLYIEDNPANLELVRKIINRQPSLDFIDAPTGEIGIKRARAEVPDVILLDINLPGLDGFQVVEQLNSLPDTRHIPIVALTAAATESDVKRGKAAGFFSYLTKPVSARELLATIRRALRPAASVAAERPLLPRGKVLVVDDMPMNLSITQKQLAKLGVACDIAEDPIRALEMLKTGAYALALVDIGMPVLNGIELTKRLRAAEQESGSYTPVVALTASYGSEDDVARYRKAGMDGQLTKPVILKELASTLHRWFSPTAELTHQAVPLLAAPHASSECDRPPVDLDQFQEILGTDDAETVKEMFDLFIKVMPDELRKLSSAVAARDKALSKEAAHRFKSAARNTAAGRLSELLQKMESESQTGVWDALERDLRLVQDECARVSDYMRTAA